MWILKEMAIKKIFFDLRYRFRQAVMKTTNALGKKENLNGKYVTK